MLTIALKNIYTIFKKEMKSYFFSPTAYVTLAAFLLVVGYFQVTDFFTYGRATMEYTFTYMPYVFLFFIPSITMRLIAEERKSSTIELLVTMPITDSSVILGKFLAAFSLIGISIIITLLYIFPVVALAPDNVNIDGSTIVGGYIGMIFLAAACSAIGILASTLTSDQIVSFILSVLITVAFLFMDNVASFMSSAMGGFGSVLGNILIFFGFKSRIDNLLNGMLDFRDILYFISFTTIGLLLAIQYLQTRKWKK